eukprot:jgi/Bigna1/80085/fgenesh1_pg.67_\
MEVVTFPTGKLKQILDPTMFEMLSEHLRPLPMHQRGRGYEENQSTHQYSYDQERSVHYSMLNLAKENHVNALRSQAMCNTDQHSIPSSSPLSLTKEEILVQNLCSPFQHISYYPLLDPHQKSNSPSFYSKFRQRKQYGQLPSKSEMKTPKSFPSKPPSDFFPPQIDHGNIGTREPEEDKLHLLHPSKKFMPLYYDGREGGGGGAASYDYSPPPMYKYSRAASSRWRVDNSLREEIIFEDKLCGAEALLVNRCPDNLFRSSSIQETKSRSYDFGREIPTRFSARSRKRKINFSDEDGFLVPPNNIKHTDTDKSSWRRHLDPHATKDISLKRSKRFECGYCGKLFNHQSNLNTHTQRHTGNWRFKCTLCEKGYPRKDRLLRHFKNKHPKEWSSGSILIADNRQHSK